MKSIKKVYICSPLKSPDLAELKKNITIAQELMPVVSEERQGKAVAPHAYLPYLLDDLVPEERRLALKFGIQVLQLCHELIICSPRISEGMANEIEWAQELHLPIMARRSDGVYFTPGTIPAPNTTQYWEDWCCR